jgi:hypothetical protein
MVDMKNPVKIFVAVVVLIVVVLLILRFTQFKSDTWSEFLKYRLTFRTPPASNGQPGQGVGGNPNTGLGRGGRGARRPSTGYPIVPDDRNDNVGTPALGGPANDYYGGMPVEDAYEVGPMN